VGFLSLPESFSEDKKIFAANRAAGTKASRLQSTVRLLSQTHDASNNQKKCIS